MREEEQKKKLPSLDELFSTEEERQENNIEKVVDIPISKIQDFKNHPFKVEENEELISMSESIAKYGVLEPAVVRPLNDGTYEMISGHRRKKASTMVGKETIRCIVKELSDDEATIIMVDSNIQREKVLPSEKAFAYKMRLEAEKHQGRKIEISLCQVGTKLRSDAILAQQLNESARNIHRYIRLTNLIPEILEMVDNGIIALTPAVDISYLEIDEQAVLLDVMGYNGCTPSVSQAKQIKYLSEKGEFEESKVKKILNQAKPNQIERIHLDKKKISQVLPKLKDDKLEDYIYQAIIFYNKHLEHQKLIDKKVKLSEQVR